MTDNHAAEKRMNAGYEIISSFTIAGTEFVLGRNDNAPSRNVTWACKGGDNYFWGHYFSDFAPAQNDLHSRMKQEIKICKASKANKEREDR